MAEGTVRLPPGSRLPDHTPRPGAIFSEGSSRIIRTRHTIGSGGLSRPQALNP